jgi:hypothetical protein
MARESTGVIVSKSVGLSPPPPPPFPPPPPPPFALLRFPATHAIEGCVLSRAMQFAGVVGLKLDAAGGKSAVLRVQHGRDVNALIANVKLDLTLSPVEKWRLWFTKAKVRAARKSRKGESCSY